MYPRLVHCFHSSSANKSVELLSQSYELLPSFAPTRFGSRTVALNDNNNVRSFDHLELNKNIEDLRVEEEIEKINAEYEADLILHEMQRLQLESENNIII